MTLVRYLVLGRVGDEWFLKDIDTGNLVCRLSTEYFDERDAIVMATHMLAPGGVLRGHTKNLRRRK